VWSIHDAHEEHEGFGAYSISISYFVIFGNSLENLAYGTSPLLYPPHRGEEGIKAFPLDGERLDRGESLLHMPPFSFSVGERKIMKHFVVNVCFDFRYGHDALLLEDGFKKTFFFQFADNR
jgi:hypothetical protein